MYKSIKTLLIFLIIGILNTIIFIQYIKSTGLPGGEVGMVPFGVIIGSIICLVVSFIIYLLLDRKYIINVIKSILLYQFIYLLILIFAFEGTNPFDKQLDKDSRDINLWIYLTSFIVTGSLIILNIIFRIINKITKN